MSTDRPEAARRRPLGFAAVFAIVVATLVVLAAVGAAVSVAQGPRATDVAVDPEAAVEASGTRVIFTTTQSLQEVDASQVYLKNSAGQSPINMTTKAHSRCT